MQKIGSGSTIFACKSRTIALTFPCLGKTEPKNLCCNKPSGVGSTNCSFIGISADSARGIDQWVILAIIVAIGVGLDFLIRLLLLQVVRRVVKQISVTDPNVFSVRSCHLDNRVYTVYIEEKCEQKEGNFFVIFQFRHTSSKSGKRLLYHGALIFHIIFLFVIFQKWDCHKSPPCCI